MATDSTNNDRNGVTPEATFIVDPVSVDVDIIHPDGHAVQDRPIMTCLVDSLSGYILGYHVEQAPGMPKHRQLIEHFMHTIQLWGDRGGMDGTIRQDWPTSGLPHAIVVDNGEAFEGDDESA